MRAPGSGETAEGLDDRVVKTLDIAARWGYGLSVGQLAHLLYRGPVNEGEVATSLQNASGVVREDGFATIAGREDLLAKSVVRHRTNGVLTDAYFEVARAFAQDLLRHSPFVRTIAVSGSMASGGLERGDDVDLNIFAEDGTKYIVYLTALLLGVKYSLGHGRRFANGSSFLGIVPKVTCVNVVWTEGQCRPFVRQDEFLAFELLRSRAIAGGKHYRQILEANPWLGEHFPQIFADTGAETITEPPHSGLARIQLWFARVPTRRRWLDRICRNAARALHRVVDLSRARDPEAVRRTLFLRRSKFPYDVFQDNP